MTQNLKKRLFGECLDHMTPATQLTALVPRTLLTYLAASSGRFPRGLVGDADLDALRTFVNRHPDLSERCGATEDEMKVLREAVESV